MRITWISRNHDTSLLYLNTFCCFSLSQQRMEREATFQYQILRVPDQKAANCVYVNGTLIHSSAQEYPESAKVFGQMAGCDTLECNISEIAKAQVLFDICYLPLSRSCVCGSRLRFHSSSCFIISALCPSTLGGLDLLFHSHSETEAHQKPVSVNPWISNSLISEKRKREESVLEHLPTFQRNVLDCREKENTNTNTATTWRASENISSPFIFYLASLFCVYPLLLEHAKWGGSRTSERRGINT